jgi:hypothetical protein
MHLAVACALTALLYRRVQRALLRATCTRQAYPDRTPTLLDLAYIVVGQ